MTRESCNRGMDTASWPWLNPSMRSGFLALCGFLALALPGLLRAQGTGAPTLTAQPPSLDVSVGDRVVLTVGADGAPTLTYQWFKDNALLADGGTLSGSTSATVVILSAALTDLGVYHVVVTNSLGSVRSLPAALFVAKRPQVITFNPPAQALAAGAGVSLGATSSLGLPISYSLVSGTATLSGATLSSTGGAVVVRASQPGNASVAAAEPVERTITFIAGATSPFLTSPPADLTVTAGAAATFRVAAIGTPAPTYQWQKDGADLAGATSATLALATTTLADAGRYTVVATNFLGTATAAATLTVRAAPVLTTVPASQTVAAGEAVTFTVAATGFPAPTYQWRRNGTALAGATAATLTLRSPAVADAGRYEVVVANALGSVTSPAATLTVTARDFGGTYFGTIAPAANATAGARNFALLVRANRTAVFLGHLPGGDEALVITDLTLTLAGDFSRNVTVGGRPAALVGRVDDATGQLAATITEAGFTLTGTRAAATGPAAAEAGLYTLALIGSAAARGYALLAADGQAFVLTASGASVDSAQGTLSAGGRLALTTASQAAIDLGFLAGAVSGTVRAGNVTGTVAGASEALAGREHLTNLSVRSITQNAAPLITGFVIAGTTPKQILIRAAGPALAQAPFNVPGALADPTLQVFRGNTVVGQNDEWGTPPANGAAVTAAAARAGAFAFRPGSADAAIVGTLPPGPYTVQIGGGNGTVLAEIYEVLENNETAGARRLVNTAARGLVSAGNPLIAGFAITGTAPQRVLIRGIGATLGAPPFNVPGALPNPQLTLFRGTTALKANDDWFRDPEAALIRTASAAAGAFALGAQSPDAAILIFLEPGAYTAQVSGPTGGNAQASTGIALIEVYESAP